jgi:hypothetical protein
MNFWHFALLLLKFVIYYITKNKKRQNQYFIIGKNLSKDT